MQSKQKKAVDIVENAKKEVWNIAYEMTENASSSYYAGKIPNNHMQVIVDLIDHLHKVYEEFLRQETYLKF